MRSAGANKAARTDRVRFGLFNNCSSMRLVVNVADVHGKAVDRSLKGDLRIATKNRLRSARLYTANHSHRASLHVCLSIVGEQATVELQYHKTVTDAFGETAEAATWFGHRTSTHGLDPAQIVATAVEKVDDFLAEYMRANGPGCDDLGTRRPDGLPVASRRRRDHRRRGDRVGARD